MSKMSDFDIAVANETERRMAQTDIEDEPSYPIWSARAKWTENRIGEKLSPWQTEDLPEERMWNSTQFYKLWPEAPDDKALQDWLRGWWTYYCDRHSEHEAAEVVAILRFVRNETWCLTWFQHYTIDRGQSDQETLDSFERYVRRAEEHNRGLAETDRTRICLMGAEDRWRWYGHQDGGTATRTKAPCGCEHCKAQGVIRIGH